MEIVLVILGVLGALLLFVAFGLLGWVLKGLGVVFDFLWDGCSTSMGCLFWVVIGILVLVSLAM